jgi:hypothetical protein
MKLGSLRSVIVTGTASELGANRRVVPIHAFTLPFQHSATHSQAQALAGGPCRLHWFAAVNHSLEYIQDRTVPPAASGDRLPGSYHPHFVRGTSIDRRDQARWEKLSTATFE